MHLSLEKRRANAQSMAWVHDKEQAEARRDELLTLIRDQSTASLGGPPPCACCRIELGWRQLYRCFICDLWFCPSCARAHFGSRGKVRRWNI